MFVIAAVVLIVLVVVMARRHPWTVGQPEGAQRRVDPHLVERLDHAVALDVISPAQRDAILALEAERAQTPRRISGAGEALAYVGGVLTLVGVGLLIGQFWSDLATWSRLTIAGLAAAGLGVAGALVREEADVALWRLRGFLWLGAVGGVAFFAGLVAADAADAGPKSVALTIGLAVAASSAALWQLRDRPLQEVSTAAGLVTTVASATAMLAGPGMVALALLALAAVWLGLSIGERIRPALVGLLVGALLALTTPMVMGADWPDAAPIVGLAIGGTLLGIGIARAEFALIGTGVLGLFAFVPWTLGRFFGDELGAPVVVLLSGALLLAIALSVLRRGRPQGPRRPVSAGPLHV